MNRVAYSALLTCQSTRTVDGQGKQPAVCIHPPTLSVSQRNKTIASADVNVKKLLRLMGNHSYIYLHIIGKYIDVDSRDKSSIRTHPVATEGCL